MKLPAIFLFSVLSCAAQVIVNGSFESPVLGSTSNLSASFSFPGWVGVSPTNGGNAGLVVGTDNGLSPAEGRQHLTLNGGNPSDRGWVQQTFASTAGATYTITFSVGRSGSGQELALGATISAAGSVLATGTYAPPAGIGYLTHTIEFVSPGGDLTLRFSDLSGGNSISDLYVDNVAGSMSAIPEPSTWAAWGGAGALGLAVWRRRRVMR